MSGILFPDLAAAFGAAEATSASKAQRDYINEDRETVKQLGPALQGDQSARDRIMSSKYAPTLLQHLERVEVGKRAKAKEDADYITGNGMAILNAPADQQPGLYARVRQEAAASGRDVSTWPTTYDPGWVQFNVNKAMSVKDHFDRLSSGPQAMPPPGGGGAMPPAPGGGGVNPNNIGNVRPPGASSGFQQPATLDDGIRLAVNNVKAYPAKFNGGQPMSLMQIGARWAPVGDGANDPAQWARNVGSIGGLNPNQPLDFNDPATAAAFARGLHGAEHGASKVLPLERYAQVLTGGGQRGMPVGREVDIATNAAPMPEPPPGMAVFGTPAQMPGGPSGAPPGMAVGDTRPQADASGNPLQPPAQAPGAAGGIDIDGLRKQLIAGGGDLFTDPKTGQAEMQNGYYVVRSTQNPRQIIRLIPAPKPKEPGSGPFAGTNMDAQSMNIVLNGDPAAPEYALAYSYLSKPRTILNDQGRPITIEPMDLSAVRKPAGVAAAPAAGGTKTALPGGGSITVGDELAPKGPGQAEMAKLRTARAEAEQITSAANDFKKEWEKATPLERARSLTGANTPLNAAYNNFALLAKGDALFKLGVLNGPDLEIIRRTIPDPSTGKSIMTTQGDVTSSVDKVLSILNAGITATEKQLNIGQPAPTAAGTQEAPAKAAKGTYMGPDNKPISWPEIEATAKNRGISIDEVIGRLGLQPTGMQ